jgi:hypothetical protein
VAEDHISARQENAISSEDLATFIARETSLSLRERDRRYIVPPLDDDSCRSPTIPTSCSMRSTRSVR